MMDFINTILEWLWKFLFVNFLWIIFTILGLLLFGLFPATVSLYTVVRKWIMGEEDIPVFKTFWDTYRNEFFKTNIFGIFFLVSGLILYFDFKFFLNFPGFAPKIIIPILVTLSIMYAITILYFFPVYVHYKFKKIEYIKYSFVIGISKPLVLFKIIMGLVIWLFVLRYLTGLIPLLGMSVVSLIIMLYANRLFSEIARKNQA